LLCDLQYLSNACNSQTFLYIMSLQTGATLITLSLLLNKVSGLYGLLVLVTGFHLSPFQLSMYIYSLVAFVLTAFLAPHIQKQSPLQCLALAWFYLIDSVINAAYTVFFAVPASRIQSTTYRPSISTQQRNLWHRRNLPMRLRGLRRMGEDRPVSRTEFCNLRVCRASASSVPSGQSGYTLCSSCWPLRGSVSGSMLLIA
jgi:hypothetical protein